MLNEKQEIAVKYIQYYAPLGDSRMFKFIADEFMSIF